MHLECMNVLSTLASTQKLAYRIIKENAVHDGARESFQNLAWKSFLSDTSYGAIVTDVQNAFNLYLSKMMEGCPGIEILPQCQIKPHFFNTKFIAAAVNG